MTLEEFLKEVNGLKSDIKILKGKKALEAVRIDGMALVHIREQTPEICLAAVKQDGRALRYVNEQTPEICLAAVKQNGYVLQYIREQTPEICLAAVKQSRYALNYVNPNVFSKRNVITLDGVNYELVEIN